MQNDMHSLTEAKKHKPIELRIHCDEAGRGPLAWPVTVGCALMIGKTDLSFYKDSKQLTKKQRESLYTQIKSPSPCKGGVGGGILTATWRASAEEIDTHGIIKSVQLACLRGLGELLKNYYEQILREQLIQSDFGEDILAIWLYDTLFSAPINEATVTHFMEIPNSYALLAGLIRDGNHMFGLDKILALPVVTIIKGDQKNPLISAASIVAKVERDGYMTEIATDFPLYHLEKHKGYGSKLHRESIVTHGVSPLHRSSFCKNISISKRIGKDAISCVPIAIPAKYGRVATRPSSNTHSISSTKPALLLHICCAPDLSRPLHRLKDHFKLYLFRYNPNIHPRKEHEQRYSQFLKLVGLEKGDYEILEDRYDPKEFFQAMIDQKETIDPELKDATDKIVLKQAGEMPERSDRCNPCYSMRLEMAARMAAKEWIPYFTSTLLISPKKKMDKLFRRGKESEITYPSTKFLWFDFPKKWGYEKANELTRKHGLRRQNYCWCGRTIPKPGETSTAYRGG
jgi:predicted adenine nucleotide alpha hydrolase (AANH) superfamily ATPase/ribonuclease HII